MESRQNGLQPNSGATLFASSDFNEDYVVSVIQHRLFVDADNWYKRALIPLYVAVDLFGAPPFNPSTAASPTGAGSVQSPTTHAQKQVTSPANPFAPSTGASGT